MNIIFLDMDGVINCQNVMIDWKKTHNLNQISIQEFREKYCLDKKGYWFIVPELRDRFNNILSNVKDCKVVWSSSWRKSAGRRDSKLFIESLYYRCGFLENSFLSWTPSIPYLLRSDEIMTWIRDRMNIIKIDKVAIIDDDSSANPLYTEFENIKIRFFKTLSESGLTENIAKNIINYFNEK